MPYASSAGKEVLIKSGKPMRCEDPQHEATLCSPAMQSTTWRAVEYRLELLKKVLRGVGEEATTNKEDDRQKKSHPLPWTRPDVVLIHPRQSGAVPLTPPFS
jgi:hypothetical protein